MADTTTTPKPTADAATPNGRIVTGIVTRDKMAKTRRVEISRVVKHAKYGKFIKQRTVCYAHDEGNDSHLGDTVEIQECRPLSKLKRWTLLRVVTKAPSRTVANLEGAVAGNEMSAEAIGQRKD
jgi:small subunit ribosomal protein S17